MSEYLSVLTWWDPLEKKVREKRVNRDDQFSLAKLADKLTTDGKTVIGKFTVVEKSGEWAGAW